MEANTNIKHEEELNQYPQFVTAIDGIDLHFYHVVSKHKNAKPLLLIHGWPGSVFEFLQCIPMLVDPTRFGGHEDDAFSVVVPSLPGYGFSSAAPKHGMHVKAMAAIFAKLMGRLNYKDYIAQGMLWCGVVVVRVGLSDDVCVAGGDWGAMICPYIAAHDPNNQAIHINMVVGMVPFSLLSLSCSLSPLSLSFIHSSSSSSSAHLESAEGGLLSPGRASGRPQLGVHAEGTGRVRTGARISQEWHGLSADPGNKAADARLRTHRQPRWSPSVPLFHWR